MKLFLYILRDYYKFVLGSTTLCLFLFTLFDFIHKTTNYFSRYQTTGWMIAKFYLYQFPANLVQVLPIAALLSSVTVMVILNRRNEITAMRAAGLSPLRIGAPLAFGGLTLSLFSLLCGEFIVPAASLRKHYVTHVEIEGHNPNGFAQEVHWIRNQKKLIYFDHFDNVSQILYGVKIIDLTQGFKAEKILLGTTANYNKENKNWEIAGGFESSFEGAELRNRRYLDSKVAFSLPVEPQKIVNEWRQPDEMAIRELGEFISRGKNLGTDILALRTAWHIKWAYPFAALVISLLGLKFGYRSERTTETVRSVLLAFGIGMSYWFILSAARALANAGDIHPFIAGWLANFVIFVIIAFQALRLNKA